MRHVLCWFRGHFWYEPDEMFTLLGMMRCSRCAVIRSAEDILQENH